MKAGLTVPTFQLYAYPCRDHACGRESGKHFDQADALKACPRTMDVGTRHLS